MLGGESAALASLEGGGQLDKPQFFALMQDFDAGLHALPATAQVRGRCVCVGAGRAQRS